MLSRIPVLVVSCDRYSDLWGPFFELFFRHWRDCPSTVYLGTNFMRYEHPRVQTITVGADVAWASGVLKMLDGVASEYVIVMLEDFFLMQDVDTVLIERLAEVAVRERVGCLRLYSIYPPQHGLDGFDDLGVFLPGDQWRITLQSAIWRVDFLRRLLVRGFSAWDFEMIGSQMAEFLPERVWGVMHPALVYDHAVEKGKWRPQGLDICRAAGIPVDLSRRGAFSADELRQHERAGLEDAMFAEQKAAALSLFRSGRRGAGLRALGDCLRARPWSGQLWVIAAAGLLGAGATERLQRWNVRMKIAGRSA